MFTGIIKEMGRIVDLISFGTNLEITIQSQTSKDLKVDESISHEGICLTVVFQEKEFHKITAVNETILKTNISNWRKGQMINLERALSLNDLLGGHLVQGHVDEVLTCIDVKDLNGSWLYKFQYPVESSKLIIPKGSICINGVSLTISKLTDQYFEVSVIPYTHQHTSFQFIQPGDLVNIEYDIIGKYIQKNTEILKN
ncbi:MAG: riboflavin synthase [Saprospiraceae bacterium]|nr:riboflavin synthase [Saprospiraceae bacterium]